MPPEGPRFSVVIPTLGRPDRLMTVLESIAACDPAPLEAIVVDGDPERSGAEVVHARSVPLALRCVSSDAGSSRQRNVGMDAATGDVICFFDDDITVEPSIFAVLREVFFSGDVVGATGRVVEAETRAFVGKHSPVRAYIPGGGAEGSFTRYGYPNRLVHLDRRQRIRFMHGSCMTVRADVARDVRFDERLTGYALAEDEDFSYRVSSRGPIVYDPAIVVHHAKAGFGARDLRAFNRKVVVNRAYLFRKNFPQTVSARLQFSGLVAMLVLHRLVNREWTGAVGLLEGWARARAWSARERDPA
jgi:GT2 family glycosyltransferase